MSSDKDRYIAMLSEFDVKHRVEELKDGVVAVTVDISNTGYDSMSWFNFVFDKSGEFKTCECGEYMETFNKEKKHDDRRTKTI